jgi:hypothetical protein
MSNIESGTGVHRVIIAFWQRTDAEIEFYIPLDKGYMEVMSHLTTGRAAEAARSWIERQFGLNPRSMARVFNACAAGSVVAFSLNTTELRLVSERMAGNWLSAWSLDYPLNQALSYVGQRLI